MMTFEELLEEITEAYLNPPVLPDGRVNADRNGHTRLADLQSRYHLSSLKIQKLLVTAGVYEPVKKDSGYYAVKKLHEAGKSVSEIMDELSLSKAAVNAFLPYERGAKDLDKLGVEISSDAMRKRKQRSSEEMKKENARDILAETMSDDALWNALAEHDSEVFLSTDGQRFILTAEYPEAMTQEDSKSERTPSLAISMPSGKKTLSISQQDVFDAYHKALEEKAGESQTLGDYEEYLRPVFIFLGVMNGDRNKVTTKRSVPVIGRCDCCGRKSNRLFPVSSFDDLVKLEIQFHQEWQDSFTEEGKEISKTADFMTPQERKRLEKEKEEKLKRAQASKAVETFNQEGERHFCKLCCQTIYDALENGLLLPVSGTGGYESLSDDELLEYIHEECITPKHDWFHSSGEVYKAADFEKQSMFLYKVMDQEGAEHCFALLADTIPYMDDELALMFRALELHKLTKAGKTARDNTNTDYDITHFKICREGEDPGHVALVGMAELMEKIKDTVRTKSLDETHMWGSNTVVIDDRYYLVGSIGTIIPTYVRDANNYRSMKDREWCGDEYGFLIDGKLFSGEEVARMFSCFEGWQIKFFADDPSSQPLRGDEFLMQIRLSQKDLVEEVSDLINMMTTNGVFERQKDKENFEKLFKNTAFEKFRLYNNSRPRGYGKLAGMEIIKKLKLIEGTEKIQEMVQGVLR